MSFKTSPQIRQAGAPGVNDDNTKGYVTGSIIVNTSVSPNQVYVCSSAQTGAATWVNAGGVTAHPNLTTLGWSASGHTGTTNSVACFDSSGNPQVVQATVENTTLSFIGGVLVFSAMAATAGIMANLDRTLETEYFNSTPINAASGTVVGPGSII